MKQYGLKIFLPIAIITAIFSLAITQSSYYRKISKSQQLINRVYNQFFLAMFIKLTLKLLLRML